MSRSNRSPRTKTQVHTDKRIKQYCRMNGLCPECGSDKYLMDNSYLCAECYYAVLAEAEIRDRDHPA